jgi:hypothetical protein
MNKVDKVIQIIRMLKEEGMVVGAGGYTGAADPEGPVAGYDKLMPGIPDGRSNIMRRLPTFYKKYLLRNKRKNKRKKI